MKMREVLEIKRKTAALLGLALILAGGIDSASGGITLPRQETAGQIEPFYLRVFKSGENAYIAGRFREAVQDLKVAVFGLYADARLLARGQALLGLSLVKASDPDAGRGLIEKALASIGGADQYETLGLAPGAASDLAALMRKWNLSPAPPAAKTAESPAPQPARPAETPPPINAAPAEKPSADDAPTASSDRIVELKKDIALNPRNAAAYTELAELELLAGDAAAAKNTLKSMITKNPVEIEGHLSLGRICYQEKSYKETDTHLEKFLDLAGATGLNRWNISEAQALRLLAFYYRGEAKKLRKIVPEYRGGFDDATIEALPLLPEDKAVLRTLLENRSKSRFNERDVEEFPSFSARTSPA